MRVQTVQVGNQRAGCRDAAGESSSVHSTDAGVPEFAALAQFAAHEEQLFAGMRVHVAEEQPQIRKFLPIIAGHFFQKGALAVDDLIVRKRQNEIFVEGVDHREGEFVVMILAVNRIEREIPQRIVHPAHVPFQIEAKAADIGGRETAGHAVDSSAIIRAPGWRCEALR